MLGIRPVFRPRLDVRGPGGITLNCEIEDVRGGRAFKMADPVPRGQDQRLPFTGNVG